MIKTYYTVEREVRRLKTVAKEIHEDIALGQATDLDLVPVDSMVTALEWVINDRTSKPSTRLCGRRHR